MIGKKGKKPVFPVHSGRQEARFKGSGGGGSTQIGNDTSAMIKKEPETGVVLVTIALIYGKVEGDEVYTAAGLLGGGGGGGLSISRKKNEEGRDQKPRRKASFLRVTDVARESLGKNTVRRWDRGADAAKRSASGISEKRLAYSTWGQKKGFGERAPEGTGEIKVVYYQRGKSLS